jgi:hydrogenase/urease accessory protein HupE
MIRIILALLLAALGLAPTVAQADDNRPLSVSISAQDQNLYRIAWKIPVNVEARHLPLVSASGCSTQGRPRQWSDTLGYWKEALWRCPDGIVGVPISITYPLANPNLATIVRYRAAEGADPQTLLLQPQETAFQLAEAGGEQGSVADFIVLGIEHILIGIDHLLFVAGLIFIARTPRRVLATVTGFTIAHSVTLALAALGLIRLPIAAIEAVIALSIVFLAVEIIKGPRDTLTWRRPMIVASAFGLLHGFGFAAVLAEIGLPKDNIIASLFAFNVGIEIGQVMFALVVMAVLRLLSFAASGSTPHPGGAAKLAGYAVGTLASFWMFERLLA